jgi:two-component system cell cycle response regulator
MNSGQTPMCAENPAQLRRSPFDFQIGSIQSAEALTWLPQSRMLRTKFSEAVLMEGDAYGVSDRLLHKSLSKNLPVVAPLYGSRRSQEVISERRANIGSFQRVLVAEHHKGTRRMLLQMLRKWGFDVVPATTGLEALKILEQSRPPELIIVSRMLPDIDVFEFCRRLTGHQSDYSPYILVLAMQGDQCEVVRALESGAAEYLTTPFEAEELRARLSVAVRILKRQENLITSRDRFRILATRDTLTGVWNRRSIDLLLNDELDRAAISDRATGVLLIDLDHFKNVNDTHGHSAGDCVLRETSRRLKDILRTYDSIGRYGGEEFLIVVPGSDEEELCRLAERLRKAVEKNPIRVGEDEIRVTLSVGAAIVPPGANMQSDVLAIADAALYDAKKFGRNRLVLGKRRSEQVARPHPLIPSHLDCPSQ